MEDLGVDQITLGVVVEVAETDTLNMAPKEGGLTHHKHPLNQVR